MIETTLMILISKVLILIKALFAVVVTLMIFGCLTWVAFNVGNMLGKLIIKILNKIIKRKPTEN